ncbi:MAG TPA: hypothetical protein VHO25_10130 [Polyangiaceae bacterium]|nr:hypothetical protein [Polyangiaceae bacterium]
METGNVQIAPDYKSDRKVERRMGQPFKEFLAEQMRDPEFAAAYNAADIEVEHQRLQSAVVEAAKAERNAAIAYDKRMILENWKRQVDTRAARVAAVDALIAFESEHKIGESK